MKTPLLNGEYYSWWKLKDANGNNWPDTDVARPPACDGALTEYDTRIVRPTGFFLTVYPGL